MATKMKFIAMPSLGQFQKQETYVSHDLIQSIKSPRASAQGSLTEQGNHKCKDQNHP